MLTDEDAKDMTLIISNYTKRGVPTKGLMDHINAKRYVHAIKAAQEFTKQERNQLESLHVPATGVVSVSGAVVKAQEEPSMEELLRKEEPRNSTDHIDIQCHDNVIVSLLGRVSIPMPRGAENRPHAGAPPSKGAGVTAGSPGSVMGLHRGPLSHAEWV